MSIIMVNVKGGVGVTVPYNPAWLQDAKSLFSSLVWNRPFWIIPSNESALMADLIQKYFRVAVATPEPYTWPTEQVIFSIEYIGTTKMHGNVNRVVSGDKYANCYAGDAWQVMISESALIDHFCGNSNGKPNMFQLIGIDKTADKDEIKRAYRRAARQWHPDMHQDPQDKATAQEMFMNVQKAYEVLSDDTRRKKYIAALALEEMSNTQNAHKARSQAALTNKFGYRSPLCCGVLDLYGRWTDGRFIANKINGWKDIINDQGKTLVTYWTFGNKSFTKEWV